MAWLDVDLTWIGGPARETDRRDQGPNPGDKPNHTRFHQVPRSSGVTCSPVGRGTVQLPSLEGKPFTSGPRPVYSRVPFAKSGQRTFEVTPPRAWSSRLSKRADTWTRRRMRSSRQAASS